MIGGGGEVKHSHATSESPDLFYTLDPQDDFETNDEQREMMKRYIEGVLEEFLTERQRQIFKMYYGEGLNSTKIAQQLGIKPQAVRKIASDTMDKVQKHKKIFLKTQPK